MSVISPFARSLLPLAALLVLGNTQKDCTIVRSGETSVNGRVSEIPFRITGEAIDIEDQCTEIVGSPPIGEVIAVCNNDTLGAAPNVVEIYKPPPPGLSAIVVRCSDGCPVGGIAIIIQFCKDIF